MIIYLQRSKAEFTQSFYDLQEDQKASFEAKLDLCESEFEKSVFTTLHEMGYTVTHRLRLEAIESI